MVGLIIDLKPVRIKKLQKELQKERDMISRKMKISQALEKGIQKNPIERNKFQID